jgi:deoxyguanosine kinase
MPPQVTAYIGLGSNLGDRRANLKNALDALAVADGTNLLRSTRPIETEPLGNADQPKYLNSVAQIQTALDAHQLLDALQKIETSLGRQRNQKWAPRTIDLDLLLYDDRIINAENLSVPHPQMHLRLFVLKSLCELNLKLVHPVLDATVAALAARLNGRDFVPNPDVPQLVSVAGLIGVGKTTLATKLSKRLNAELLLEPYDTNPFLPKVYGGQKDLALHCQLYFLLNRVQQLSPANFIAAQLLFTDYVFEKDLIYATQILSAGQFSVYEKLYAACPQSVIKPVLVIYLRDTAVNCLDRIHHRNRPYEQKINTDFLSALDEAYERLFADWTACPVIRVSKSEFDCTRPSDLEYLIKQINAYICV